MKKQSVTETRHAALPATVRLAEGADLTRNECVALAIRKAFPLPASGAFTDLLAAIDDPLS